ncbi:unnamed protein product, partial [Ectocarpus sp. 12 AP-2014]
MNTNSFKAAKATVLEILTKLAQTEAGCRSKDTSDLKLYNLYWGKIIKDSYNKITQLPKIQSPAQLRQSLQTGRDSIIVADSAVITANVVEKVYPLSEDVIFHIRRPDWPRESLVTYKINLMHPMLQSFFSDFEYNFCPGYTSGDGHTTLVQFTKKHHFFNYIIETKMGEGADARETEKIHSIDSLEAQPLDGFAVVQNGKIYYHG